MVGDRPRCPRSVRAAPALLSEHPRHSGIRNGLLHQPPRVGRRRDQPAEPADIAQSTSGEGPRFLHVDSPQGERSQVANEIAAALRGGASPGHFLVLQNESALVAPFVETLNKAVGQPIARDLQDRPHWSTGVRVCSLNAATGLESPVVFLCGMDGSLEKEGALGLGPR
jgi:hypothetical protein